MFNAWKKEVFVGSIPVFCARTTTSTTEICPTFAGAATLLFATISLISLRSPFVKIKPQLSLINGSNLFKLLFFFI